jgi:broad specificity phosphatase PhoE
MAILLIRHGETEGNRTRVIQRPDIPLSERGLEQASRLSERLRESPIDEIWSSPLARARMTAAALERTTGIEVREHGDLQERSLGDLRGTAYSELDFDPFDPDYVPPNGESWAVFYERVDRMWEQVVRHWFDRFAKQAPDRHLAVVSHGLFLRSLIERRLVSPSELESHEAESGPFRLGNTALTIITPLGVEGGSMRHRVELLGCTAHLAEEPLADVGTLGAG